MWNIANRFLELLSVRYQVGPLHGSENICMLLYSLVRREQPEVVVELGTGMGVSSVWIAAALKENGHGMLYTYDNGSHYDKPDVKDFLRTLSGPITDLGQMTKESSYDEFLVNLFDICDVSDRVRFSKCELDLPNIESIRSDVSTGGIDILFSDYMHSAEMVKCIIASFLPAMSPTSSIFIDSASSHIPSYMTIDRLVSILNSQKFPVSMSKLLSPSDRNRVDELMKTSIFKAMHLMEKLDRPQNSTAWLRIEPADMVPPITSFYH